MSDKRRKTITIDGGARKSLARSSVYYSKKRESSTAARKHRPQSLLSFSDMEKKKFLASFDFVFAEFEGVIWKFNNPIQESGEAINKIMNANKIFKIVTGDTTRDDEDYLSHLNIIGVASLKSTDIIHPVKIAINLLKPKSETSAIFSVCCPNVNAELSRAGLNVVTMEPMYPFKISSLDETRRTDVTAVMLDYNYNITYGQLAKAHQYLQPSYASLYVTSFDAFATINEKTKTIGIAGFVNMLTNSTRKVPILCGKPGPIMGADLITMHKIQDPSRVLFVGGSLINDIQFAMQNGFQTLFVLTGESTQKEMSDMPENTRPDYLADSIADFVQFFR